MSRFLVVSRFLVSCPAFWPHISCAIRMHVADIYRSLRPTFRADATGVTGEVIAARASWGRRAADSLQCTADSESKKRKCRGGPRPVRDGQCEIPIRLITRDERALLVSTVAVDRNFELPGFNKEASPSPGGLRWIVSCFWINRGQIMTPMFNGASRVDSAKAGLASVGIN